MRKLFLILCAVSSVQLAVAQRFDRSQRPKPGPAPAITIPDPVVFTLKNGIVVLVVENHKLPKVSASYSIDTGPITEGSKAGVTGLLSGMMNEGTTTKTKAQFDEAVDQLGATVSVSAKGGQAAALSPYFEQAFSLMSEAIKAPAFPQTSFDKLKAQHITGLKTTSRSATAISSRVVNAFLYGVNNPLGEFETEESINALTLEDVKATYRQLITPSRGYLTIVGDITPAAAKKLAIKALENWQGTPLKLPDLTKVNAPSSTVVDVVNLPNAVQSEITVSNLIELPMNSPDYHAVLLANQILGGGADSKLFRNLRERHAFTYGAYSKIGSGRFQTTFSATASVRNVKVDSAVVEILREINIMRTEKVSPEVLQEAKNLYNGNFALNLENPGISAGFASSILINNLPRDFYRTYLQKINAVTAEDVLRVSRKYFLTEGSMVIIVGKAEEFSAGLLNAGYKVRYFDSYARPIPDK